VELRDAATHGFESRKMHDYRVDLRLHSSRQTSDEAARASHDQERSLASFGQRNRDVLSDLVEPQRYDDGPHERRIAIKRHRELDLRIIQANESTQEVIVVTFAGPASDRAFWCGRNV
jgi:hypothetical protein